MEMEHSHHDANDTGQSWLFSRTGVATCVALAVLGFLIYEGHGAHLLGALPYLLILSCPLMHIFMHGGHGHHHHGGEENEAPRSSEPQQPGQQASNTNQPQHQHKGGCH